MTDRHSRGDSWAKSGLFLCPCLTSPFSSPCWHRDFTTGSPAGIYSPWCEKNRKETKKKTQKAQIKAQRHFFLSARMNSLQPYTVQNKCLQDLYLYIGLKNPSLISGVLHEKCYVRVSQILPLNNRSVCVPHHPVRMFRVSEGACLSETLCFLCSSQCWTTITSGWFYSWEKGLVWSWCSDFWVNNHQNKSDHCGMFLGLSSTNREDFTLLFHDGLWFEKRGAELLHKCGSIPWQSNKCFCKDPMISKNWPLRPSLSRANIKILFSSCF